MDRLPATEVWYDAEPTEISSRKNLLPLKRTIAGSVWYRGTGVTSLLSSSNTCKQEKTALLSICGQQYSTSVDAFGGNYPNKLSRRLRGALFRHPGAFTATRAGETSPARGGHDAVSVSHTMVGSMYG